MIILYSILYLYAFWLLYVLVMGLYRAHLSRRLLGLSKVLAIPVVLVGVVVDALANWTIACVVFADRPREALVTQRLMRYQRDDPLGWRGRVAAYICDHLLDVFDPTGDHC